MARVALERVEKRFGDVTVIPALDLDVADGHRQLAADRQ